MTPAKRLYCDTPLLYSPHFTEKLGTKIYLKMEALQPCGSFKLRGIGHACALHAERGATRFVSSSGGNAGLAVAWSGRELGIPVTVVVPTRTSARAKELITKSGAEVIVHGDAWDDAHAFAQTLLTDDTRYIHPFDDPEIWEGHSTMIDELRREGIRPDAVAVSVGGGGLLCGVAQGLLRNRYDDVEIIAAETEGAASYHAALSEGRPTTLSAIKTIATTLGARRVCEEAVAYAERLTISSELVTDRQAVLSSIEFLDTQRLLVEPACGAALAALEKRAPLSDYSSVVVIVCGGAGCDAQQLFQWRDSLQ